MARIERFRLPDLGEGLPDGEIVRWLVAEGDQVVLNQPIAEIETAKAIVELPAKWAGKITRLCRAPGETVPVGAVIVEIETRESGVVGEPASGGWPVSGLPSGGLPSGGSTSSESTERTPSEPATSGPADRIPVLVGYGPRTAGTRPRTRPHGATLAIDGASGGHRPLAKPPVRKLARDLGVDLSTLVGTGPYGSVTRDDLLSQAGSGPVAGERVGEADRIRDQEGGVRSVPVRGVRKLTAEAVTKSAFAAPHVTEFLTVDATRSVRLLARLRAVPAFAGVKLSPLVLVAKAVLTALPRHPMLNARWGGDHIDIYEWVKLGVAVATDRGLVVPTIGNAAALSTVRLAGALERLVVEAREGKTAIHDLSPGTFTITNIGVFGVDTGTPILPPGQAAILAIGAIRDAPWVHKGKIKIRKVVTLALSFDHRIIDGEQGSLFLREVGEFLTDPDLALLAWG